MRVRTYAKNKKASIPCSQVFYMVNKKYGMNGADKNVSKVFFQ